MGTIKKSGCELIMFFECKAGEEKGCSFYEEGYEPGRCKYNPDKIWPSRHMCENREAQGLSMADKFWEVIKNGND